MLSSFSNIFQYILINGLIFLFIYISFFQKKESFELSTNISQDVNEDEDLDEDANEDLDEDANEDLDEDANEDLDEDVISTPSAQVLPPPYNEKINTQLDEYRKCISINKKEECTENKYGTLKSVIEERMRIKQLIEKYDKIETLLDAEADRADDIVRT